MKIWAILGLNPVFIYTEVVKAHADVLKHIKAGQFTHILVSADRISANGISADGISADGISADGISAGCGEGRRRGRKRSALVVTTRWYRGGIVAFTATTSS